MYVNNMDTHLLIIMAFGFYITPSDGLLCYEYSGPLNKSDIYTRLVNCDYISSGNEWSCTDFKFNHVSFPQQVQVKKRCTSGRFVENFCENVKTNEEYYRYKITSCYVCKKDGCNSSETFQIANVLLLFGLIGTFSFFYT